MSNLIGYWVLEMARRPIFIATGQENHLVEEMLVDFIWNPGFSPIQKKKNVSALHESAKKINLFPILEVSTKSEELLGRRLSAFSLKLKTELGEISLESAYQGSKVFKSGGPYTDIYNKDGVGAKTDERVKTSGELVCFRYFGQEWPLTPKTAFYDWLYLSALRPYKGFLKRLFEYKGFTDIEFNPQRSINCQARSCALLISLLRLGLLDEALSSQRKFIKAIATGSFSEAGHTKLRQGSLAV